MPSGRPTAAAAATALLGVGLALAAIPAHAEPLTCQGQAVTVSGDVGTVGDDVMVVGVTATGTASSGAGNDLVCIHVTTSQEPFLFDVDAGPGDDRVFNESTNGNTRVSVTLGAGADTYLGSDTTGETVVTGASGWARTGDASDVEVDAVDTRGGNDAVYSGSVDPGARNQDRITLGDGDDALYWAGDQTGPTVDFGTGRGALSLYPGWRGHDLAVDAGAKAVTVDGRRVLAWTGEVLSYILQTDSLRTTFTGTDADESLTAWRTSPAGTTVLQPPDAGGRRNVDMRGGDDHVVFYDTEGGDLVGGDGSDHVELGYCSESTVLVGKTFTCLVSYSPRVEFTGAMDAWEKVSLAGAHVTLTGTDGADDLRASGTTVRVNGRGGDDLVAVSGPRGDTDARWPVIVRGGDGDDTVTGSFNDDRLVGGRGADLIDGTSGDDLLLGGYGEDRLAGGRGADRIVGGKGRDRALGAAGRDACVAEVRRSCELS